MAPAVADEPPLVRDAVDEWGPYSPGGWSTLHRSAANRKLVAEAPLAEAHRVWTALGGASVLTAPTLSPDGRTLYVTTGRAAGHSNLHAFDLEGGLRWQAAPWQDGDEGVDPCAILSSPIVDRAGDVYVSDCNQLFAFRPDGSAKWVVPLPPLREGDRSASEALVVNAFTTAVFTRDGDLLGVTNMGDVVVVDRATGRTLAPAFRLPGHLPGASTAVPMPASLFGGGLVDPAIRDWAWQLLFGGAMRSANTPAVDLASGRVFVAATSTTEGRGALYGLDPTKRSDGSVELAIAFATEMGPGSGSSPALSPGADAVYVSDEEGFFYSVDARDGHVRWRIPTRATSAAAAVGANGDVYALQANGPSLVAITQTGEVRWESDLAALTEAALPSQRLLGPPVAIGNGNPTVVGDRVLVPVAYGYETTLFRRIPWPVSSFVVEVDAATGRGLRNLVALPDDSTGITAVLPDGSIVSSLGTAISSGVAPLERIARWLLPEGVRLLRPIGGIQVARPLVGEALAQRRELELALASRAAGDRARDAQRRPIDVLELAGVGRGSRVADLMTGSGWYAEVLARAVGSDGFVLAQNNAISAARHGEALRVRLEAAALPAIEPVVRELDDLALGRERFDAIFLGLFYHDTVWMGADRSALLRAIRDALVPGGVLVLIDHAATPGSGVRDVESLHRIDVEVVKREAAEAGLRLTHESSLLANPRDDRTRSVFDESIRGDTDRFLLRFTKAAPGRAIAPAPVAGADPAPADR